MLKQAILYEEQLKQKYKESMCDDYFKFYNGCSYKTFNLELSKDDWNTIERVSVDSKGNVIGFICCEINRDTRNVSGFGIINFTKKPNTVFVKDVLKFLKELKHDFRANRIEFTAYVKSPAENIYRRFIEKHGGRVVGVKFRNQILSDGRYYDSTVFEILREQMRF